MAWFERKLTKTEKPWFEKINTGQGRKQIIAPEVPDFQSRMAQKLQELQENKNREAEPEVRAASQENAQLVGQPSGIRPDFEIAAPIPMQGPLDPKMHSALAEHEPVQLHRPGLQEKPVHSYAAPEQQMQFLVTKTYQRESLHLPYALTGSTNDLTIFENRTNRPTIVEEPPYEQEFISETIQSTFAEELPQNPEIVTTEPPQTDELPDFESFLADDTSPEIVSEPEPESVELPVAAENVETLAAANDLAPVEVSKPTAPIREKIAKPESQKRQPDSNAFERASVTPAVNMIRQHSIPFQILKTQKKAFEISNPQEAQSVIAKLEETLDQFGIEGRVIGLQRGPIVTRYELRMAPGIKVSRILSLTDELAMALEAIRVRIEAPIPGRSTVGIEIPNKDRAKVLLGDILHDDGFKEHGGELTLPLGRDIAGNLLLEDLTRMPHLLIAGATGSGKSVAVNSFITSTILNRSPEEVRFMLIDPKLVELSSYNDIPHLLHPVITDSAKAILALNWLVEEMERRYEDLGEMRVRDIRGYNAKLKTISKSADLPPMPYIIVLIDELGDLMMVAGKEVENSIIRLAQKARAVGIHLILATQRPSVDVITALIKANCPARIALQVAQKTDSRTILDSNGAEQLLGQGDMLFKHPSKGQLIRAQAPLVLDEEVEMVVNHAKKMGKPEYITLEDPKGNMGQLEPEEEALFDEAWAIIVESQKASASYLQRRLRIGYNRAARLIEAFEARGMIGPQIGSKPREILG